MPRFQFQYDLNENSAPFSVTPGGGAEFLLNGGRSSCNKPFYNVGGQINWLLRNSKTSAVFAARQHTSLREKRRTATLLSEEALIRGQVYETVEISAKPESAKGIGDCPGDSVRPTGLGFAKDTRIMTSRGDIPVQHLTSGDRVLTRDSGMQLVRWVGKTVQNVKPGLGPVFFSKGTINNSRDLSICPNQCVVLKGAEPMAAFGDPEVLVPAYKFINEHKVIRSAPPNVTYYRILTNRHELVYAEAAAIESFRPSRENVALLGQQQQSEIQLVFPDILEPGFDYGPPARRDITTPTQ